MVKNPLKSETKLSGTLEGDIQPNGVDLRLGKVYTYQKEEDYFLLSEDNKHKRTLQSIQPSSDGYYKLEPGYYMIEFKNTITVGKNETGWVFPRSTLMRNGVSIHTAVYDSGYSGPMCAGMTVTCPFYVTEGTRIAQYVVQDADASSEYNGQYQNGSKII